MISATFYSLTSYENSETAAVLLILLSTVCLLLPWWLAALSTVASRLPCEVATKLAKYKAVL